MASLIPGYEYDIFISYRQKDNKHDGWVTEFVDHLKSELDTIFKEEISVYFDMDPHDGLLETHSVDRSLMEKLKCIIFIPIVSQTYCDPESFAWQHELCAFNRLAKEDPFGRNIKLAGGNVASRLLPVKIHELDPEDKTLLENELGGALRCIEFIYTSAGVNRPLRASEEHPHDNLKKTYFRDQINKVAHAVKEILYALIKQNLLPETVSKNIVIRKPRFQKNQKKKIAVAAGLTIILVITGYLLVPYLFRQLKTPEKSIAVLPFINDSPDTTNIYFINGLMEEILTNLQKISVFDKVVSRTSVEQFKGPGKPTIPDIARKLGVNYIVEGSGQKYGNSYRLRIQLIEGKNDRHLWAESYEKEINHTKDIYGVQSEIAETIAKELKGNITDQEKKLLNEIHTNDTLAYFYYLRAMDFNRKNKPREVLDFLNKAIDRDSLFILAYLERSAFYSVRFDTKSGDWKGKDILARQDLARAMAINPELPEVKFQQAVLLYRFDGNYDKALKLLNEVEKSTPEPTQVYILKGTILKRIGQWKKAIQYFNAVIHLDPLNGWNYNALGDAYCWIKMYTEAIENYIKSYLIFGDYQNAPEMFRTVLLWKGDLNEAIQAFKSVMPDSTLRYYLGYSYYYRKQFRELIPFSRKSENQEYYAPKSLIMARNYFYLSDYKNANLYADSAIIELTLKIREAPEDDRYYSALGFAFAFKRDKTNAIENGKKAVRLLPLEKNALEGFFRELDLAKIYVLTGEFDLAMDKLEYLLTIPGELSVPLLKVDPVYDKLRDLPRFKKILATDYKTIYQ